jgi:hypothetical protein
MRFSRRAESNDRSALVDTFVDVGPLFTLLSSPDHQVIYGRRGTGKTHALAYLADKRQSINEPVVFVDLRTIGSSSGIYSDMSLPLAERATRLLSDTLATIHELLLEFFIDHGEEHDLSQSGPLLDELAHEVTNVKVTGTVESEISRSRSDQQGRETHASISGGHPLNLSVAADSSTSFTSGRQAQERFAQSGTIYHSIHFGSVVRIMSRLVDLVAPKRLWILLDEWSSIPYDLQPYLADFLKRSILPVPRLTVKIAAIEQRARFRIALEGSSYIGIELGADIAADIHLDDFMVFDNDEERATQFFKELIFRHFQSVSEDVLGIWTSDELVRRAFSQANAFVELVRAAEGVPRDAMNVLALAAQGSLRERISINGIRTAALNWYQRDKESAVRSKELAVELLYWIIEEVIAHRRARGFMLRSSVRHALIDYLFDHRILHLLKRNVSSRDEPGIRYDVYKLDYGCYVEFINTLRFPMFLLSDDITLDVVSGGIEVPADDYRSLRRAILDLEEFEMTQTEGPRPLQNSLFAKPSGTDTET